MDEQQTEMEQEASAPPPGLDVQPENEQKKSSTDEEQRRLPADLETFKRMLEDQVGLGKSFDVVAREMTFGGRRTVLFYMNGFAKDEVLTDVLTRLTYLEDDELSAHAVHGFLHHYVPAIQVETEEQFDGVVDAVMAGNTALFIEHERTALIIDAKNFPGRSPDEPSLERVVRGSRDGFVETLMVNITLVRRRLRDPGLRYVITQAGRRTQTDVCLAYIEDIADPELVKSIRSKIDEVELDGLPLADKQLEEATVKRGWNPYPLVRYTERPDVVAAQLMEGNVAVFVDTTPSVMLLPTTFFDLVQHAEENRQTPFIGTYLRWIRYFGILSSLFLLPLWVLFVMEPALRPAFLSFIGPQDMVKLPLIMQFIIAEVGVDLMRMASVHTPTPLATAMSLIAAILIGDIAVQSGFFVNEVVIYMAIAAIGMFATPSYELGLANRIVRLLLLVVVAVFKLPGFLIATTLVFIILVNERSFNHPYMWPFIPFDARGMLNIIIRVPVLFNRTRPNLLNPKQLNKMPEHKGGGGGPLQ
ncbi:spore germination protein [Paenibacillus daejeonensis]|uniref:spore germination protein n=1 Tax=Paenibacillus daejeonensis TaxID=135193 RepID=UPI000376FF8D|nr:spore germination protein [Paenibacillus daejeonensis]